MALNILWNIKLPTHNLSSSSPKIIVIVAEVEAVVVLEIKTDYLLVSSMSLNTPWKFQLDILICSWEITITSFW